ANAGGTSGFGVRGAWRLVGNGTVNGTSDSVINIQPGQFPPNPGLAQTTNPINNIFRALWQPTSFANRTVNFHLNGSTPAGDAQASVYLDLDGNVGASVYVNPMTGITYGSVHIPVAPAPASLALLVLGGLVP